MLQGWGFSPCLIIYLQQRYWECGIRGVLPPQPPHTGVLPPIEPVSQWTIPHKKTNRVGVGGLRTYFFEKPLELLGFCFIPKFQN